MLRRDRSSTDVSRIGHGHTVQLCMNIPAVYRSQMTRIDRLGLAAEVEMFR